MIDIWINGILLSNVYINSDEEDKEEGDVCIYNSSRSYITSFNKKTHYLKYDGKLGSQKSYYLLRR